MSSRGNRRDQAHAMARTRSFDDGRFTLLAPSTPRMMIGAHVGGIAKEDLGFFALRQALILGYSFLSHCPTRASSRSCARCKGFWQVMPSCASSRPTELALNTTPNLSLISFATISRVHSANANFSCSGFFRVMVL